MAGAGVRLFTAGQILTASQVNTYLMDQVVAVFPDSASRDAAFGGLGEPSLSDGRFCYLQSDHKLYFYNHDTTSWEEVGAQVSDGEITAIKLDSNAVTEAKIASNAVTTGKIADANITYAKLAPAAITSLNAFAYNSVRNTPTITANAYTLTASDLGKLVELNNGSTAMTLFVPDNSVGFNVGDRIDILQTMAGINMVTIAGANGTVTVNSFDNQLKLGGQWASATLIKRASTSGGVWVLIGNITS